MRKLILFCTSLCAMALLFSASPVRAQSVMWVASYGSGAICSQTAPCANFQTAIDAGATEIHCLNSGNYGGSFVSITAPITIDCGTGNVGTVSSNGTYAIVITGAATYVVLRHLSLNGNGVSTYGIEAVLGSATLIIEDCMIQGFGAGYGVYFSTTAGRGLLQVSNSQIFGNSAGVVVQPQNGQIASVTLNQVELVANSQIGLWLSGGVVAGTIRNSVVGQNGTVGVYSAAGQAYFTVEESSIVDNLTYGIQTNSPGSSLKLGASTIGGNGTGVFAQQGSIISFGNNQMSDNGSNGNFTSTTTLR